MKSFLFLALVYVSSRHSWVNIPTPLALIITFILTWLIFLDLFDFSCFKNRTLQAMWISNSSKINNNCVLCLSDNFIVYYCLLIFCRYFNKAFEICWFNQQCIFYSIIRFCNSGFRIFGPHQKTQIDV